MRGVTTRRLAALCLLIVSIAAGTGSFFQIYYARKALHSAQSTQATLRRDRKLTELHFCRAINQGRKINNRDRKTFVHAIAASKHALEVVTDPKLRELITAGLARDRTDLAIRPHLTPLNCVKLIASPPGTLPPSLATTTTTG